MSATTYFLYSLLNFLSFKQERGVTNTSTVRLKFCTGEEVMSEWNKEKTEITIESFRCKKDCLVLIQF